MSRDISLRVLVRATASAVALLAAAPALGSEYAAWHKQIGNSAAVARSANYGSGVRLAVLDTGTYINHVDLRGRTLLRLSGSTAGGVWHRDTNGHGTTVASAALGNLNGSGIVGVAPRAGLISMQISTDGTASSQAINRALRLATDRGAKVINLSFGYNGWTRADLYELGLHRAMQYAARRAVIVVSAGNDGNYKPDDTAMHILMRGVAGAGIMAGSVDRYNRDSSFSNAPGTWSWHDSRARDYFLNAPGEDIRLATNTGRYEITSGTSFSAPIIAGAAALVRAKHPHLTPRQTVAILLNSAKDLGAAGTDILYGRGLLQVNRALQAVGAQRLALSSRVRGPSRLLDHSTIAGGTAMGSLGHVRASLAGAVIFDDYGRDFIADLDGRIVARVAPADPLLRLLDPPAERLVAAGVGPLTLLMSARPEDGDARRHLMTAGGPAPAGSGKPEGFALTWRQGDTEVVFGHGARFARDSAGPFLTGDGGGGPAGPVFALAEGGAFGRLRQDLGDGLSLGARFSEARPEMAAFGLSGAARAVAVEAAWRPTPGLRLEASPTLLREDTAALGTLSSGATALASTAETFALTTSASLSLGDGLTLRGHYTEGVTSVDAASGSLFRSVEPLRSRAYGASLEKAGLFDDNDSLGVSVSRPLRIHSGAAMVDVPVGRTLDGAVVREARSASLVPDGTQTDLELTYTRRLDAGMMSSLHLVVQDDAGHQDGVTQGAALARLSLSF